MFIPTVAEVATTLGWSPKLLASFATGKTSFAARLFFIGGKESLSRLSNGNRLASGILLRCERSLSTNDHWITA